MRFELVLKRIEGLQAGLQIEPFNDEDNLRRLMMMIRTLEETRPTFTCKQLHKIYYECKSV